MFYLVKDHRPHRATTIYVLDKAHDIPVNTCFTVIGVRRIKSIKLLRVRLFKDDKKYPGETGYIFVNWD